MKILLLSLTLLGSINAFAYDGLIPCKIQGLYSHKFSIGTLNYLYGDAKYFNFDSFEKCYEKAKEIAEKNKTYTRNSTFRVKIGDKSQNFVPYLNKLPIFYVYSNESPKGSDDYYGTYEEAGSVTKLTNQYDNGVFLRGNANFTQSGDVFEVYDKE